MYRGEMRTVPCVGWLLVSTALAACAASPEKPVAGDSGDPSDWSPSARPAIAEVLREDLAAPRHPSDGGGRAWLESDAEVVAGGRGRFEIVLEVGERGIAEGGAVLLQPSAFWGWSPPQAVAAGASGYTTATTDAGGVELSLGSPDPGLLAIRVGGRALTVGEQVRITYGAGPAGSAVDRYAERRERIWIAVDGDGDGVRAVLPGSPAVDVRPGRAARLVAHLPSVAAPGETVSLRVAVLDAAANAWVAARGRLRLELPEGLAGPDGVELEPDAEGTAEIALVAWREGLYRVAVEVDGAPPALSNPLEVREGAPRVLWADLHGHTQLSDGTATPADYLRYARDAAALDVAAVTDHDHWGVQPLATHPELWREVVAAVAELHRPGRFVALSGFEWTSWLYGHRHVLYFDGGGEVLSSVDDRFDTPGELWSALAGSGALTVAHHPAGGPIATAWQVPPDPELEPVVEVVSVHGASEAPDAPAPISAAAGGAWVRDALARGYHLGFVGGGDSHDGHPGLAHLGARSGGLAALVGAEHSRASVRRTLLERRCYATNGPRILLRVALDGHPMGAEVPRPAAAATVYVAVAGTAEVAVAELVRGREVVAVEPGDGRWELAAEWRLADLEPGEVVYVRVVQRDGGAAWSSPFKVTGRAADPALPG